MIYCVETLRMPPACPGENHVCSYKRTCKSFASKVMDHVRFGLAAGCEAVAVPRRQQPDYSGLCPWFGLSPSDLLGRRPHQGHSPKSENAAPTAGHSHRLTSGGKAEPQGANDFESHHLSLLSYPRSSA